ncbi:MAG: SMC-Scp complex subunit ScpB [Woeseiaceae bacterium]|nr:SMC-Scp complex subunit ScpB [Woeseiaceae bacterium]
MDQKEIQYFVEAALLAAGRPLSADQLMALFDGRSVPPKAEIRKAVEALNASYEGRGITIAEVASGYRIQVTASMAERLQKLWEERPPRYSRALFETLALVAYRQPITRGEIEEIRGVSVSSNIVRTMMERDWIRVVGHRDVPGRPAMFGTTKSFLDYFGLKKLDDLPELADLADWESLRIQLDLPAVEEEEFEAPPEIPEIPVLDDEDAVDLGEPGANDESMDESDIPELTVENEGGSDDVETDSEDELVVSEWPDPVESSRG